MNFNQYAFADIIELVSEKIKVQDLSKTNYISTENMLPNFGGVTAIDDLPNSNSCNKFSQKDVLFSNIRTYFKKVWFADFNGGCSPDVLVMRSKDENILLNEYLFLLIRSDEFINFTIISSNGAKMPRGDKNAMKKYIFNIPSIDYQKKCIEHYFVIDQKIQLNTQTNQTLEAIAQAIFKSWFVDFDPVRAKAQAISDGKTNNEANLSAMAVISGKAIEDLTQTEYQELWEIADAFPSELVENAEFGEVPKGWEVIALDEIADYQNGLALQKFRPENDDEFLPVVKIAQLRQGYADGEEKARIDIKPECIIDSGDVVFSWSGSLLVDFWCGGKAALNQHLFKVTSNNYPKWFYYLWTKHHLAEFQRIAADKAVTMGHIKREHLSQALCAVPDKDFLSLCNSISNALDLIIANRISNFDLAKTRDLLLPKLLSGEIML